jgi:hypothetical protein
MHVSIDIANAMFVSHHAGASSVMIMKMFDVRQKVERENGRAIEGHNSIKSGQKS